MNFKLMATVLLASYALLACAKKSGVQTSVSQELSGTSWIGKCDTATSTQPVTGFTVEGEKINFSYQFAKPNCTGAISRKDSKQDKVKYVMLGSKSSGSVLFETTDSTDGQTVARYSMVLNGDELTLQCETVTRVRDRHPMNCSDRAPETLQRFQVTEQSSN